MTFDEFKTEVARHASIEDVEWIDYTEDGTDAAEYEANAHQWVVTYSDLAFDGNAWTVGWRWIVLDEQLDENWVCTLHASGVDLPMALRKYNEKRAAFAASPPAPAKFLCSQHL